MLLDAAELRMCERFLEQSLTWNAHTDVNTPQLRFLVHFQSRLLLSMVRLSSVPLLNFLLHYFNNLYRK
jgi:hypothetical protein